jgi:hypothetical protein
VVEVAARVAGGRGQLVDKKGLAAEALGLLVWEEGQRQGGWRREGLSRQAEERPPKRRAHIRTYHRQGMRRG